MVALFAGAAVAALATSAHPAYDYALNGERGFFRAPNTEIHEHNFGDHIEQRIKFTVPSVKHLFEQRGRYIADCNPSDFSKVAPVAKDAYGMRSLTWNAADGGVPCFVVLVAADKKFSRPILRLKKDILHYTGDKTIGKWSYTDGSDTRHVGIRTNFHTTLADPKNQELITCCLGGTPHANSDGFPVDVPPSVVEDVRNSNSGVPDFPSYQSHVFKINVQESNQYADVSIHTQQQIKLIRNLPVIELVIYPAQYDPPSEDPSRYIHAKTLQFDDVDSLTAYRNSLAGDAHREKFIEAIPDELGFEFMATADTRTPEQVMDIDPLGSGKPPTAFEIASLSIGSVALAIGLGILVSKISLPSWAKGYSSLH